MYLTLLSTIIMVKKSNEKWQMCVDYTYLSKAYPKDSNSLSSIDSLVDIVSDFRFFFFMDTYLRYNQILMYPYDEEKTTFINPMANYCYKVMLFGLKNVRPPTRD